MTVRGLRSDGNVAANSAEFTVDDSGKIVKAEPVVAVAVVQSHGADPEGVRFEMTASTPEIMRRQRFSEAPSRPLPSGSSRRSAAVLQGYSAAVAPGRTCQEPAAGGDPRRPGYSGGQVPWLRL